MAINLAVEYSPLLDKRFTQKSLTEAWCGHDYSWEGVNAIKVWTIGQGTINDYTASGLNRFTSGNAPTEIQDELNTYTLVRKRSFAHTLDITNMQDQKNIKKANAVIKQIWDEQLVPEIEMYRLNTWANGAGTVKIDSALTKSTVIEALLTAGAAMNNHFVNRDGRVIFVTESLAVKCKLASELQYNDAFTTKAIVNGQIAKLNGVPIVSVPDSWMPAGVEFMIKYKKSSADPKKLHYMNSHTNPPGIAGTLIEGLVRYDSFVLAQKAYGIYVYGTSGAAAATPTAALSSSKIALTSSGATKIYYTEDGSNPKTSPTRSEYSTTITPTAGAVLKAYATKTGALDSGILTIAESDVT